MKKALLLVLCLGLVGCATISVSKVASNNKNNLLKLRVGMTEQEVLNIMGAKKIRSNIWNFYTVINNPYRSEIIQAPSERTFKALYYVTDARQSTAWETYSVKNNDLTPLVFENGKFIGCGVEFIQ